MWKCWRSRYTTAGPDWKFDGSGAEEVRKYLCDRNENVADQVGGMGKTEMVIYAQSYADPAKTKVIGKVVRHTNIFGALIPDLLNKDDKLIVSGQIILAQN